MSQALRRAKTLKGKIAELSARASQSVSYRTDSPPAFQYGATVELLDSLRSQLVDLETSISITNAQTSLDFDGKTRTLTWAVRRLQELKSSIAALKALPVRSQTHTADPEIQYVNGQHTTVQVSWTCELPEAGRAERVEAEQATFDRLNDAVERKNHTTVLAV